MFKLVGSRMDNLQFILSIFSFICIFKAVSPTEVNYFCENLDWNIRLKSTSSELVIDDLINNYQIVREWSKLSFINQTYWEYSIDLTCLEHIFAIVNAKKDQKFIELIGFTAHSLNHALARLVVEYTVKSIENTMFRAHVIIKNAEKVKSLVLNHNPSLRAIPPDSFMGLTNLRILSLAWNNIACDRSQIYMQQASFRGLSSLVHLDLSGNLLDLEFHTHFFIHMPQLVSLNLSISSAFNNLAAGSLDGLDNLQYLDLSSSKSFINSFTGQLFKNLRNLKVLNFSGKTLTDEYPDIFCCLGSITELILVDFYFEFTDGEIPTGYFDFPNKIESLDLSWRSLRVLYQPIGDLSGLEQLKRLSLRNRRLNSRMIGKENFHENIRLTHLDLSSNIFDAGVFEALEFTGANLVLLNLGGNKIQLLDYPINMSVLSGLHELHLAANVQLELNVSHFLELKKLRILDISRNSIEYLTARSFQGLNQLQHLNLADNIIRTIENGTFAPLVNLTSIDLRKNQIRNLFFYGLTSNCAIFHDGLSGFNMSLIDLSQMSNRRANSFLHKTLHLRNSRRLSIYRNIKVLWRSTSTRPNCSLYFYVLRQYRVISFEISEEYLRACLNEELEARTFTFYQADYSSIQILSNRPIFMKIPTEIQQHVCTSDGFLLGASRASNISQIVILELENMNIVSNFTTDDDATNIIVVSDDFMLTLHGENSTLKLWNITSKANPFLTCNLPSFLKTHSFLPFVSNYLLSYEKSKKLFCSIEHHKCHTECKRFLILADLYSFDLNIVMHRQKFAIIDKKYSLDIWNFSHIISANSDISISSTIDNDRLISLINTPTDMLISLLVTGELRVWMILDNGSIMIKHSTRNCEADTLASLKSVHNGDTLITLAKENKVKLWSTKYEKFIERVLLARKPSVFYASFYKGLLIIDDEVYQF